MRSADGSASMATSIPAAAKVLAPAASPGRKQDEAGRQPAELTFSWLLWHAAGWLGTQLAAWPPYGLYMLLQQLTVGRLVLAHAVLLSHRQEACLAWPHPLPTLVKPAAC